jgi:hypothetical protein
MIAGRLMDREIFDGGKDKFPVRRIGSLAIALLCLWVTACGGTSKGTDSVTRSSSSISQASGAPTAADTTRGGDHLLGDGDNDTIVDGDNDNSHDNDKDISEDNIKGGNDKSYHDSDDNYILSYGHTASSTERHLVTVVVKRYYVVAAADDGSKACSLLIPDIASAVPEDYGNAAGPAYLRGQKTCHVIVALMFKHLHSQLTAAVSVTGVRVDRNRALALLGSSTMPSSWISLQREGGIWKVDSLLGTTLH